VLPLAIALERMESIPGWHLQVIQVRRQVDILEFASGSLGYIRGESLSGSPSVPTWMRHLTPNSLV
jgi:hypothetical protein